MWSTLSSLYTNKVAGKYRYISRLQVTRYGDATRTVLWFLCYSTLMRDHVRFQSHLNLENASNTGWMHMC